MMDYGTRKQGFDMFGQHPGIGGYKYICDGMGNLKYAVTAPGTLLYDFSKSQVTGDFKTNQVTHDVNLTGPITFTAPSITDKPDTP